MQDWAFGQKVPSVFSNIIRDGKSFEIQARDLAAVESPATTRYGLERMQGSPSGTKTGLSFDFGEDFNGILYYGFIPYGDSKHPMPVYFRMASEIREGKSEINILDNLSGRFDMVGWEKVGYGTIGYRVADHFGQNIYDGIIAFQGTGPILLRRKSNKRPLRIALAGKFRLEPS